jgi:hypothetical protein
LKVEAAFLGTSLAQNEKPETPDTIAGQGLGLLKPTLNTDQLFGRYDFA